MGLPRLFAVVFIVFLTVLCLSNCTEKKYINQPLTDAVHIHGVVYGWRCGVGDQLNNPRDPRKRRFSVTTGEPATVTFIRDNGFTSTIDTDDSSAFELYLSAGSHRIIVETGFSYEPDTVYNVQLKPGDTTLALDILYATMDPLHLQCVFQYLSYNDTLGADREWQILYELNQRSYSSKKPFRVFDFDWSRSPVEFRSRYESGRLCVYVLPILRRSSWYGKVFTVGEARYRLQTIIDDDSTGTFPHALKVYLEGGYICLDE